MIIIYDYLKSMGYEKQNFPDESSERYYILFLSNGKCLKVSKTSEKIIEKFDGNRTLDDVLNILNSDGIDISKEELIEVIRKKLMPIGVFGLNEDLIKIKKTKLWFHFPIVKGHKLKKIFDFLHLLFIRKIAISQLIIIILSYIYVLLNCNLKNILSDLSGGQWLIFVICICLLFMFHELGHAAAANYYNCKIGNIGVGLYLFRPVLYADLSDTWRLSKRKRMIVDFGGIYFQIVFSNAIFLIYLFLMNKILCLIMIFDLLLAIFNVNPFLKLDGYWVLSDYLEVNNVNDKAFMYIDFLKEKIGIKKYQNTKLPQFNDKVKKIMYFYIGIYLLVTFSMFGIGIYMCMSVVVHPNDVMNNILQLIEKITQWDFYNAAIISLSLLTRLLPIIYAIFMIIKGIKRYKQKNDE